AGVERLWPQPSRAPVVRCRLGVGPPIRRRVAALGSRYRPRWHRRLGTIVDAGHKHWSSAPVKEADHGHHRALELLMIVLAIGPPSGQPTQQITSGPGAQGAQ